MARPTWGEFERAVLEAGLRPLRRARGHWQILDGALLVNFYLTARKGSRVYVVGTTGGFLGTMYDAIEAARAAPICRVWKDRRRSNYGRIKRRLLRRDPHCHWCHERLTVETGTIDHLVPLARGGLDNANNMVLACQPCNHRRGHEMPELSVDLRDE